MDGMAIFRLATPLVGPFLDRFFAMLGWDRREIDHVVPIRPAVTRSSNSRGAITFVRSRSSGTWRTVGTASLHRSD